MRPLFFRFARIRPPVAVFLSHPKGWGFSPGWPAGAAGQPDHMRLHSIRESFHASCLRRMGSFIVSQRRILRKFFFRRVRVRLFPAPQPFLSCAADGRAPMGVSYKKLVYWFYRIVYFFVIITVAFHGELC